MSDSDPYKAWKEKRTAVEVDQRFGDRVMERIRQSDAPSGSGPFPAASVVRVMSGFCAVAALLVVSLALGILRIGSLSLFLVSLGSKGF